MGLEVDHQSVPKSPTNCGRAVYCIEQRKMGLFGWGTWKKGLFAKMTFPLSWRFVHMNL
jgi:hypothetical protein